MGSNPVTTLRPEVFRATGRSPGTEPAPTLVSSPATILKPLLLQATALSPV